PEDRERAEQLGVTVTADDLSGGGVGGQAQAFHHLGLDLRRDVGVGATAPEILPTAAPSPAFARRSASRISSAYQPATLKPNVIGSAWMPWLRPTISAERYCNASRRTISISRASSVATTAVPSRSWTAVAVSSRSELVS